MPVFSVVFGIAIRKSNKAHSELCIYYPNGVIYWNSFVCSGSRIECRHWPQQNCFNNFCWVSLHILFYHWWNESRLVHGCVPGIKPPIFFSYIHVLTDEFVLFIFPVNFDVCFCYLRRC